MSSPAARFLDRLHCDLETETSPLIMGYLRAGAWVCGKSAWDPDFNTAGLPMSQVDDNYAKHFQGRKD